MNHRVKSGRTGGLSLRTRQRGIPEDVEERVGHDEEGLEDGLPRELGEPAQEDAGRQHL